MVSSFLEEYKKLNREQREAVEAIDGPVMVIAGPGTGKTQILSLRIANILKKTDVKADGILCLTFTNSAVSAMQERLAKYIGPEASKVGVFTFHSFGMKVIGGYYQTLGLASAPVLLEDSDLVIFYEGLLREHDWQYLRPRFEAGRYFEDLKSVISLLKREQVGPKDCLKAIKADISSINKDPESISSRGESKGELKQEALKKVEALARTEEAIKFFELYEKTKKEKNVFDYDDILENLLKLAQDRDVRADILEQYLYVLVDEHQDSSGVQNEFLVKVWGEVEKPNIFVVGDDRQLIYGFGGASIAYFESFKDKFEGAKLITLVENYRSTQLILDIADALLQSLLSKEKLITKKKESHPIKLIECENPKDEIVAAGLELKEKIEKGVNPNDCAILVPKNRQVRSAIPILRKMGLPVSIESTLSLFTFPEAQALIKVLKIISRPDDNATLALSFFDKFSGVDPLSAHRFLLAGNMRNFSLTRIKDKKLFPEDNPADAWFNKLVKWVEQAKELDTHTLVKKVGEELVGAEITGAFLQLLSLKTEKTPEFTLAEFVSFIDRLENYNEDIPLHSPIQEEGVKVLTLHGSKGLEFDFVWIAHMDERSLTSGRRQAFMMPKSIEEKLEKRDKEVYKRQLYVAITRTKRYCRISYARHSDSGRAQELARIVADLPTSLLSKEKFKSGAEEKKEPATKKELANLVGKEYPKRNVSVSLLNNFFECSWKWYFMNLLQLPEQKKEILEFGNAVHSCIDKILKSKSKISEEEVEKIVGGVLGARNFWSGRALERIKKEILGLILNWARTRFPRVAEKRENEKSISAKMAEFPHLNFYGKIDLVEELPEGVRVVYWKTGSVRRKSEIEKIDEDGRMSNYLRQLAMYSYLVGSERKMKSLFARLEFLEGKGAEDFYERVIGESDIELLRRDIKDYDEAMKSGEWVSRACRFNSYGKNVECTYCRLAKIYE